MWLPKLNHHPVCSDTRHDNSSRNRHSGSSICAVTLTENVAMQKAPLVSWRNNNAGLARLRLLEQRNRPQRCLANFAVHVRHGALTPHDPIRYYRQSRCFACAPLWIEAIRAVNKP
jgi:hypothetical protein